MRTQTLSRLLWTLSGSGAAMLLAFFGLAHTTDASPATTFNVDTTLDEPDDNTADNLCHTATNHCSLRGAVQQANQLSGVIILVPAGTYILTDTARGDLNLNSDMTIQGANANTTIIEGNPAGWTHRILHVADGVRATISAVTIRYGNAVLDGGGISNNGTLMLANSLVYSNTAADQGGGIYNKSGTGVARLYLFDSTVLWNVAIGSGPNSGQGGGIYNGDQVTLTNSFVYSNSGVQTFGAGYGGGIYAGANSRTYLTRTLVSGNAAYAGGGVYIASAANLYDNFGAVSSNRAITSSGAGIYNAGFTDLLAVTVTHNIAKSIGGGIYNETDGNALLVNSAVLSNTAQNGGGIANYYTGTLFIANSVICDNLASTLFGGGIWNAEGAMLTLLLGEVTNNRAPAPLYGNGGGVENDGTLLANLTTVSGNLANNISGGGGGINSYGNITLTQATITNNSAINGGGINIVTGTAYINQSTISNNAGGGIWVNGAFFRQVNIDNSTISGNSTTEFGGGIASFVRLNLTNDTISGNSARGSGGGIYAEGVVYLNNDTIAFNTADSNNDGTGDGGGFYNAGGRNALFYNTILADNTDRGGQAPDCGGELSSEDYNLIQSTTGCTITGTTTHNIVGKDPLLAPLADNGGPTLTHALSATSPAIDAGNPSGGIWGCAPADQRGVARPQGPRCDIGAYETPFIKRIFLPLIER